MVTKGDIAGTIRKARVAGIAEWYAAGLTRAALRSLVRSGDLVRLWPGVYATRAAVEWAGASPARGHALLAMAARAALGGDSVVSHHSAALIHGLELFPPASGRLKYSDPQQAVRQLERDQRLRDLGYKVVHFTWRDLFQQPGAVIERIRRACASTTPV